MSAISKTEEYIKMRVKMGLPARWRSGGVEVIPFQASWLVSQRTDRPYPKPSLGQSMDHSDHRFGYRLDPVALVEWATEWLRAGESVMGFYPWRRDSAKRHGQFHFKREGKTVLGYCEMGLIHYVFRPQMINSYAIPLFYQRHMAAMNMDDFNQLYAHTMLDVDLNARETLVRGLVSGAENPQWITLANTTLLRPNDLNRWGEHVPFDKHVLASVASLQLDYIRRLWLRGKCSYEVHTAIQNILQIFNQAIRRPKWVKSTNTLGYAAGREIFNELILLKVYVENEDNRTIPNASEEIKKIFQLTCERIQQLLNVASS